MDYYQLPYFSLQYKGPALNNKIKDLSSQSQDNHLIPT